jgi:hypothetical protein
MTISPNRLGLISLSQFAVNAHFAQTYGAALFKYQGEETPDYEGLCAELQKVLADALAQLTEIRSHLPDTHNPDTPEKSA